MLVVFDGGGESKSVNLNVFMRQRHTMRKFVYVHIPAGRNTTDGAGLVHVELHLPGHAEPACGALSCVMVAVPGGQISMYDAGDKVRVCGGEGNGSAEGSATHEKLQVGGVKCRDLPGEGGIPVRNVVDANNALALMEPGHVHAEQATCEDRAAAIVDEHEGCRPGVVLYKLRIGAHAVKHGECAGGDVWLWCGHSVGVGDGGSGGSMRRTQELECVKQCCMWPNEEVARQCAVGEHTGNSVTGLTQSWPHCHLP